MNYVMLTYYCIQFVDVSLFVLCVYMHSFRFQKN